MTDETTWRISQLTDWLNAVIATSLGGEIWVEGEISNLQRSTAGHVYFTLVEPDESTDRARSAPQTLAVTLFDWHRTNVNRHLKRTGGNVRMGDGVRVRIRGAVEIYGARSQLQLKMTGIDPVFTLGSLAAERARLLATLQAEGLLDANRMLAAPALPLRLVVITSIGSAAHADALHELSSADVGFDVTVIDARVQGAGAPASLITALEAAELLDPDLVVLVRGGGARTDLVAFDDEGVARAIATCPIPVWVGLGHETDRTVADELAQRSLKTPTACASAVVDAVAQAIDRLERCWETVLDATEAALRSASQRLNLTAARLGTSTEADLRRADRALMSATILMSARAATTMDDAARSLDTATARLTAAPAQAIAARLANLDALDDLVRAYDPTAALARGWSITRTASGQLATAATLRPGDLLVTTLADGTIHSIVEPEGTPR